ncbi:hypothetical protein GLOIN_2v1782947 [Rhizophagus irregularis DAOM 181602=DAOM 197198]|uniref:F-box domain-containing protein n=1 Tax=Rhizophagus irregularis (strain DAOM 181602 / DAOM 197198 / MUCL 43194) TaxID=747089 RepID=A0A2P4PGD2_RHIID|nr:hypothetical protein GLOIN_2v1782947 [Rhizophagus irregularis DAOM 181602=DAOM 197198]POG64435.1 hypothetical protein GLOIN_2v1782947 [Rhizophagus irregularis DAOM 181602=DAOM 197198]GET60673.1 hypothetical protein GLOIN_2v1782947 [Rhizophagus irregularis DAOM 181602=DAOM 197198]|eukprot:XP_025171301.1 hypothetical protein GLOIN_2v1782947 [Rhizophagus irregularis DAOM 181602=DAOM 197198]
MSCSKIFSEDLPELTYEVIKYFQNDYSTLYSCILINRLWCRLAIPLLWDNPFSICTKNNNFIEIYLHNNLDFITKLNEYKFYINNSLSTNTLHSKFGVRNLFKAFDSVSKLIFKIFIENEIKLHTLEIEISDIYYSYSAYLNEIL